MKACFEILCMRRAPHAVVGLEVGIGVSCEPPIPLSAWDTIDLLVCVIGSTGCSVSTADLL